MMERLTTMRDGHPVLAKGYEERFSEPSLFFMLLNRVAAYEDTGRTPEEVEQMNGYMEPFTIQDMERFREIMQAEKDGRLVVLKKREDQAHD